MNQKTNQGNYHEAIILRKVLFNISDTSKKRKCTGYLAPESLRIIGKPQNQNPVDESEYCLHRTKVEDSFDI